MNTRVGVVLSILAFLFVSALAIVRPWEPPDRGVAQTPPEDREYGYLDQGNHTYVLAQWNPEYPGFGGVVLSIDGLGAVWTETGLQVTDGQDGTLVVSYSGAALLDTGATFDGIYGAGFTTSGSSQAATLSLAGTIAGDRVVASFQVTVNGNPYVIETGPFVQDAEPATEQVLALLQADDWAGLYGQMYLHFRQSMTQQDFIAMASGATQTEGSVVRYAVVPGFDYSGQPGAGHRAATGYVTMLAAQGTVVTRERSAITLIREENTWKVVSLDEPESSTTLTTVPTTGAATNATTDPQTGLAEFAFFGQGGQHYAVRVSSGTVTSGDVTLVGPSLTDTVAISAGSAFLDTFLGEDGTYELIITPSPGQSGTVTAEVFTVSDSSGSIVVDGPGVVTAITTPGQNATLAWAAQANDEVSVQVTGSSISSGEVRLLRPDGTVEAAAALSTSGATIGARTLATAGTYTIVIDPSGASVGSATVSLLGAGGGYGITPGGAAVQVTIATANENAELTFGGTAGQRVSVQVTNSTLGLVYLRLLRPDGTTQKQTVYSGAGGFLDTDILATSGTYTLELDPSGTNTGSATVTLYDVPADAGGSITPGATAQNVAVTTPGQNATWTFAGTTGQRVSTEVASSTIGGTYLRLLRPDGSTQNQTYTGGNGFQDVQVLATSGLYTLVLDPSGTNIGSATVTLYDVPTDAGGSITPGATAQNIAITTPGQNATWTFTGTAGQRVSTEVTNSTLGSTYIRLLRPDGTSQNQTFALGNGFQDVQLLATTGTYTLVVDPNGTNIGTATVMLYDVPADAGGSISPGASAQNTIVTTPGQNASWTFAGSPGQRISTEITNSTIGATYIRLLRPDGSSQNATYTGGNGFQDVQVLATSGTYTLVVDPNGTNIGSATVMLYDVPADPVQATTVGGGAVPLTVTTPGQNAQVTFSASASQVIRVEVTGATMYPLYMKVLKPDGSTLTNKYIGAATYTLTNQTLPVAGTYTILMDPVGTKVGDATVQVLNGP